MATKLMQSSDLQQILELADSHSLALRSAEAASALIELTHEIAAGTSSAMRSCSSPRSTGPALARRAAHEPDPEAKAACEAALSRRVVSLRSA